MDVPHGGFDKLSTRNLSTNFEWLQTSEQVVNKVLEQCAVIMQLQHNYLDLVQHLQQSMYIHQQSNLLNHWCRIFLMLMNPIRSLTKDIKCVMEKLNNIRRKSGSYASPWACNLTGGSGRRSNAQWCPCSCEGFEGVRK